MSHDGGVVGSARTPARDLAKRATEAQTIAAANAALSDYHRGRRQALSTE